MLSALSSPMLDEAVLAKERRRGEQGDAVTVDSVEREIPIPVATLVALEAWLRAHPQRRGGGLRDDDVLFVSLARASTSVPAAISQQGLAKLVRRYATIAGVPERLAHPHALRDYYATTLAGERVAIQEIKARLGHASIETTARYLAELTGPGEVSAKSSIATTRRNVASARGTELSPDPADVATKVVGANPAVRAVLDCPAGS